MTHPKIFIIILVGLFACGQRRNEKIQKGDFNKKSIVMREEWTIYSRRDSLFAVKRLLSTDSGLNLQTYIINTAQPEAAKQTFSDSKLIANENEAAIIKTQAKNFNWTPFKGTPTLFVQIAHSAFKYDMEPWDKRGPMLDSIETALKRLGQAEWTGCDVGPGGLNMLFEFENTDAAIPIILAILKKYGYDQKTTIARRIKTADDDWFYEVLYPANFSGTFLTM